MQSGKRMRSGRRGVPRVAIGIMAMGIAAPEAQADIPIFGGPTYDSTATMGYLNPVLPRSPGSTAGNGTAVGYAKNYIGFTSVGDRAVRWDASGAGVELGNLGTDNSGKTNTYAYAINIAGTAVGLADKYIGGTYAGGYAVRWDASGTAATELGNLGTDGSGIRYSQARAINTAGTAVGNARKFTGDTDLNYRAVRWDASGTAATELGNLGTDSKGITDCLANDINAAGVAVGYAFKYTAGRYVGFRAVRWDASGTAATELGNLGTDNFGDTLSEAYAISSAGIAVGQARNYIGGTDLGFSAVAWGLDGIAIDLNTLLSPADQSLWTLKQAIGISDTNWVTGIGSYDPDAAGPLPAYDRMFLMQVPEPTSLSLLTLGALALLRRKRTFPSAARHDHL